MDDGLPYVDEHTVTVAAPRDRVWGELLRYVNESLATSRDHPLARVLGASPRSGFRVTGAEAGERLALAGRHRFSRYALVFALDEQSAGVTLLRATTHAAFPGLHGTLYRRLVVGTRVHALVTRRMLETVRKASEGAT